jgi:multicomponent Na+:H+ antiporter subunit F
MITVWLVASAALFVALLPCLAVALRGGAADRLVGLQGTGIVLALLLITLAEAMQRPSYLDLAVAMAILSFGGGLVFARFLERWL